LIELLVVCAIIVVITTLVLIDNNKFGGDVKLENFAYDVALSVRQTQIYGIAVERFGSNNFSTGYGMHFSLSSPTQYLLFADEDGTGIYDAQANPSELVPGGLYTIDQGFAITSLCVIPVIGGSSCTPVTEIDILYVRPEPDAYISAGTGSNAPVSCIKQQGAACNYEAQITLSSPKGGTRTVVVDITGQISVEAASTLADGSQCTLNTQCQSGVCGNGLCQPGL
jgi:hypothetical protein